MSVDNIHLVGSIGLADAESVFRSLSETLGVKASRYPDGEPGVRTNWLIWQAEIFEKHSDFEPHQINDPLTDTAARLPEFTLKAGIDSSALTFEPTGYAKEAIASYAIFKNLRDDGAIPGGTRFQVSLPTPAAVVTSFVMAEDRTSVEPAYEQAMRVEVQTILENIPHQDLAIQWDIAIEVIAYEGAFPMFYDDIFTGTCERMQKLVAQIPEPVQVGFHLCYGDPGHKHVIDPKDLGNCVKFTNVLCTNESRSINFIHMPVLRERNDDAYFAPLKDLNIGDTELVLGLVHYTDGVKGTRSRMQAADKVISHYSIATECGFGRRSPETIPELLKMHVEVAS
jgi:methionine synthase II (cobalamin-independent)